MIQKTFVIKSESKYLKPVRDKLTLLLKKAKLSPKARAAFLLAVSEACTNSMRHAYQGKKSGKIRITFHHEKKKTVLKIRDYGWKIDFSKVKMPKLPPEEPHGLGIYLMKTMMDKVQYNASHRSGNEVVLIKYQEGDAHEDSK